MSLVQTDVGRKFYKFYVDICLHRYILFKVDLVWYKVKLKKEDIRKTLSQSFKWRESASPPTCLPLKISIQNFL